MLSNFQFLVYFTGLLLLFYWFVDRGFVYARASIVIFGSIIVLAVISIESLLLAVVIFAFAHVLLFVQKKGGGYSSVWVSVLIFLPLIMLSVAESYEPANSKYNMISKIGLSYYSLKLYSMLRDQIKGRYRVGFMSSVLYIFFYPVFTVGPIENIASINIERLRVSFEFEDFLYGLYRVLLGVFKVSFIAENILLLFIRGYSIDSISFASAWLWTIASFIYLYINFSGFSDIAIGLGRLFGVNIRENFNHPYLARNIQEFWQRWHMSLGGWVSNYLFFPLVRNNGKPFISVLVVFLLMGLWHKFTLNYLLWGLMHGTAMGLTRLYSRNLSSNSFYATYRNSSIYRYLCTVFTLLYVAMISKFANLPSLETGVSYLQALIP